MEKKEAKRIVEDYLYYNLDDDCKVLGEDHPYNDTTIGKIRDAFYQIRKEVFN